jgi:hypothetical protein
LVSVFSGTPPDLGRERVSNSDSEALARRERLNEIYQALWSTTRDAQAPPLSTDDHVRATKTLITLGADPAENPIFANVEDRALAEEYAALLIEEANAQEEGARHAPEAGPVSRDVKR